MGGRCDLAHRYLRRRIQHCLLADWESLAGKLSDAGTRFIIEPQVRFKGQVGEQATMFFLDPAGNALEFKAFGDIGQLFAK